MTATKIDSASGVMIPTTAILELTYKCNHKCKFCSCPWEVTAEGCTKYEKGAEMTFEEWKRALDILASLGVKNLSISGGEALMCEHLLPILDYIRSRDVFNRGSRIVVISNGLLMNEDYLRAFKKYDVHLSMSLPGIETFKYHTGVDNAKGVLHWFGQAKKMGLHTTVNVTVTKQNYHELFATLAMGLISGADTILLNRFLPGGRGLSYVDDLVLNSEQLQGMLDIAEEVLTHSGKVGVVGTEFPKCVMNDADKYKRLRVGTMCSAAKEFFVVDPSGMIRTCNHSPRKVGHIFSEPIIFDIEYWNIFQNRAYIPTECTSCSELSYCDCGCREAACIAKGNVCALDPCIDKVKIKK